jgi:hypothetical protein
VYDVPGDRPTSPPAVPEIVVGPVLVTVDAANTPYVEVVPWRMSGTAAEEIDGDTINATKPATKSPTTPIKDFLCIQREVFITAPYCHQK